SMPTLTPTPEWGIVFTALMIPPEEGSGNSPGRLYIIHPDGSGLAQLARDTEYLTGLKASPDGKYILFAAKREDTTGDHDADYFDLSHLYVVDVQSSEILTLTSGTTTDEWFGVADWSPDGKQIAFASSEVNTPCSPCPPCYEGGCTPMVTEYHTHLYVINRDGTDKKRLTLQEGRIEAVAWSPTGEWIAFEQLGVIWAIRPDGSGWHKVADAPIEYWMPYHTSPLTSRLAWSPDGRRLAFAAPGADGKADVWITDAEGSGLLNLTGHPAEDLEPAWSPDGRYIALISNRRGNWGIYVADVDEGGIREVYYDLDNQAIHPTWSPDSTQVAFTAGPELWKMSLFILDLSSGLSHPLSKMLVIEPFAWISISARTPWRWLPACWRAYYALHCANDT
ncbi:MAG: hypothetical protein ACK8QZ_03815, partial [Anaerolineales bacterium]